MFRFLNTIKGFILSAAFVVSLVLFVGMYLVTYSVFDSSARDNAEQVSKTLAEGTFNAMFQIMRQGWTRPQLEEFINNLNISSADTDHTIRIFRGDKVSQLFGPIEQDAFDEPIKKAFTGGEPLSLHKDNISRYIYPLQARDECLRCHVNAEVGDVLGVIDVSQNLSEQLETAGGQLLTTLLWIAPFPFIVALGVAFSLGRRIDRSIVHLGESIASINRISDFTDIELKSRDLGFDELNQLFARLDDLSKKLKSVAVDKELLEFEIRLLEKFVITSDVVRDWREYVCYLINDINQVIDAYTMFSIFKVDEELFDLEIFWIRPPERKTREEMEQSVVRALQNNPSFAGFDVNKIKHNVANSSGATLILNPDRIEVQTKSLLVETPKIGGIVGIGVHVEILKDETRTLVMESILSTLLNVVGSVKAIYKYTRDLEYYATRDPLTNLYNQRIFWELLSYEVQRAKRHQYEFAVLVIDMDNFKSVNDSYGHSFGDRFLESFAVAVNSSLRQGDVLARYGGDEFVVILPETGHEDAGEIADRILTRASEVTLEAPDGSTVKATVSIGMALYPEHAEESKDLFLFADNMMYKAKSHGKNRLGEPSEEEVIEVFRNIGEKNLLVSKAIEERTIIPHYQPIVDTRSGEVVAHEVLSRLPLSETHVLGAGEFIELAEKSGQIHKLDLIVMEKAIKEFAETQQPGLLFLNLSPRALGLGEYLHDVKLLTRRFEIEPERIVFELTERDTVKNPGLLEKFVEELKMNGYKFAIDDFGSGFSSFHYLKRFPIDIVKIEGDFINNMAHDQRDLAVVHSIAALTQELGILSVAEHVEDEQTMKLVREAGIDLAQGYHIGKPGDSMV